MFLDAIILERSLKVRSLMKNQVMKFMRIGKDYSVPVDAFSKEKNEGNKIYHWK